MNSGENQVTIYIFEKSVRSTLNQHYKTQSVRLTCISTRILGTRKRKEKSVLGNPLTSFNDLTYFENGRKYDTGQNDQFLFVFSKGGF